MNNVQILLKQEICDSTDDELESTCSICLDFMINENYNNECIYKLNECKHIFHVDCLDQMMKVYASSYKIYKCPLCRKEFDVEQDKFSPLPPPLFFRTGPIFFSNGDYYQVRNDYVIQQPQHNIYDTIINELINNTINLVEEHLDDEQVLEEPHIDNDEYSEITDDESEDSEFLEDIRDDIEDSNLSNSNFL